MKEDIEKEQVAQKKRNLIIATIIGISVLLVALVVFMIWYVSKFQTESFEEEEQVVEEVQEEPEPEPMPEPEPEPLPEPEKVIKDNVGKYYKVATVQDAAGNTIFSTVYPEDFPNADSSVTYDKYSTRYPETLNFVTSNENSIVQFTYISPQHFFYRKSSKGKTRDNERDVFNYMTFYKYDGIQPYLEALISSSYTDIKKLEFIEKNPLGDVVTEKLKGFAESRNNELASGGFGDIAKIADDTEYAVMGYEYEADVYSYKATTKQDNVIYMDFYIPVMANTLTYSSAKADDCGEVTEWFIPCIAAFEAGNEELHDLYKEAFYTFVYNSKLNKEFFYENFSYGNNINQAVTDGTKPVELTADKLKEYHDSFSAESDIGSFNAGLMDFLNTYPAGCRDFHTEDGSMHFSAPPNYIIGYYDSNNLKLFISEDATEYPGPDYGWLQGSDEYINENAPAPAPEPAAVDEASEPVYTEPETPDEPEDVEVDEDDEEDYAKLILEEYPDVDMEMVKQKLQGYADEMEMPVEEYIYYYGIDEAFEDEDEDYIDWDEED